MSNAGRRWWHWVPRESWFGLLICVLFALGMILIAIHGGIT